MSAKKNSNIINQAKGLYAVVAMVIALFGVYLIAEPSLPHSSNVLGANTLLARGGEGQGNSGQGQSGAEFHGPPPPNVEINRDSSQGGQNAGGRPTFNQQITPSQNGSSHGENMMFGRPPRGEDEVENGDSSLEVGNTATDGGHIRHFGAISHFPISINPETNEMSITTPAGSRVVTVLPDQAVQNMLTRGIISKIGGHIATGSGELSGDDSSASAFIQGESESELPAADDNIELTEENGSPVYKIHGQKEKRFLGLLPVEIDKTLTVSADTGNVESTQISPFQRFLDLLSL